MKRKILTAALLVVLILVLMPTAFAASGDKLVAMTYDDGPGIHTERLLDGLAERGVSATFFVQGVKVEQNQQIIQRMIAEGHQVANHSYNHPDLSALPLQEAYDQLKITDRILNDATGGYGSYYYRAPYGNSTETLRELMEGPFFYWSLDSEDWLTKNEGMIRHKIITEIFDGAIILAHDTVGETVDATLEAIDHLQEQGYEFVTLKELFRRRGARTQIGKQYYSYVPSQTLLPALEQPEVWVESDGDVATVTMYSPSGVPIYYRADGEPIVFQAERYYGQFTVELPCTIRAVAAQDLNGSRSKEVVLTLGDGSQTDAAVIGAEQNSNSIEPMLTRAELAERLYHQFAVDLVPAEALFTDVSARDPRAAAITWCYYEGIFSGTGYGTFEPDRVMTRQELAKVLFALLDMHADTQLRFVDEDSVESWAQTAVQAMLQYGIMELDEDYFNPYGKVTMQELEQILDNI